MEKSIVVYRRVRCLILCFKSFMRAKVVGATLEVQL